MASPYFVREFTPFPRPLSSGILPIPKNLRISHFLPRRLRNLPNIVQLLILHKSGRILVPHFDLISIDAIRHDTIVMFNVRLMLILMFNWRVLLASLVYSTWPEQKIYEKGN